METLLANEYCSTHKKIGFSFEHLTIYKKPRRKNKGGKVILKIKYKELNYAVIGPKKLEKFTKKNSL
jgi:hypothetical protein